ncbi:related to meiosis-specific MutS homolog [Ustilago bromivora]|uniref:Related to meiosis-specific MutS homolog n=1 Tax=Ustilago bromivora TaxID=307758 RepID=A0A8H8QJX6_9BASI|nr:related to meiosis-specific MutS homolog [Ustilago bromivora]
MQFNNGTGWQLPQLGQGQQLAPPSRSASSASTSSFRIPGILPANRVNRHEQQPMAQPVASNTSFVRLFAPTPQQESTNLFLQQHGRDTDTTVDWLPKGGPNPREFIDNSQAGLGFEFGPRPDSRLDREGRDREGRDRSLIRYTPEPRQFDAAPMEEPPIRPFTASSYHRSKLVTADGFVGNYVCAVLENRGTGREVGIASIDRETGLCVITQIADTPTYVRTIQHISMYPPSILLVPASGQPAWKNTMSGLTSQSSKRRRAQDDGDDEDEQGEQTQRTSTSMLIKCLEEICGIQASPYLRRHWNYHEGARWLDKLLVDDAEDVKDNNEQYAPRPSQDGAYHIQQSQGQAPSRPQTAWTNRTSLDFSAKASTRAAILVAVADKYYLLSAVAALFGYFTDQFSRVFTSKSLRIRYVVPEGKSRSVMVLCTVLINSNTAHDLELVRNSIDPRSQDCLYGLLNHCASPMGKRLLKMNILQPLTDLQTLAARQEAVAECVRYEERFYAIQQSLRPIRDKSIDLDKLIHILSCPPKRGKETRLDTERKIESILSLRTLLSSLGPARAALQNASSGLLQAIWSFLDSEQIDRISESIHLTIDEDIAHAKGGITSRNAKMYAVRAERSPLLDVARQTYRENLEDIIRLCDMEKRETGLDLNLKLVANGFLKQLNARLVEAMNEVCTMSDLIIEQLIEEIIGQVASLYKVSEALALLDMVVSFAHVSKCNDYVRPVFGETLDIRNARHPILDRADIPTIGPPSAVFRRRQPFVPNDIYLAPGERVCLVTGPNMSGKSTFLRQIALITVLACIGCFVPATRATTPMPDAILSLLTHEDDPTQNLSTFAAEMRTSAFILSVGTPRSLVILDEMGRGTSPDEGCAVATAIIEEMINENGSKVFFATHFGELVDGLDGKEGFVCQHLEVSTIQRREDVGLVFHHRLHLGPGLNTHYSLQVAKMMGCFSNDFLERAEEVAVAEQAANADRDNAMNPETRERRKLLRRVVRDLCRLIQAPLQSKVSEGAEENAFRDAEKLIEKLATLQINAANELDATFEA